MSVEEERVGKAKGEAEGSFVPGKAGSVFETVPAAAQ